MALIFKKKKEGINTFCWELSSFEVQCIKVESATTPVMCAIVHWSPKPDKHFIKEFTDFLFHCATSYGRLLILGDFNIHVCCPGKP